MTKRLSPPGSGTRNIDDPQVAARLRLADGNPGPLRARPILKRAGQNLPRLGFGHAMTVDVRLASFRICIETNFHGSILRIRADIPWSPGSV